MWVTQDHLQQTPRLEVAGPTKNKSVFVAKMKGKKKLLLFFPCAAHKAGDRRRRAATADRLQREETGTFLGPFMNVQ